MSDPSKDATELPKVCILSPCFNEEEVLRAFHARLSEILDELPQYRWEIMLVEDGSTDATVEILHQLNEEDPRFGFLLLSRNFGHQISLSAGLDHIDADAVVVMDCDLQHPPELIPELIEKWQSGVDVVSTVRQQTENTSLAKKMTSRLFYRFINFLSDTHIVANSADFVLLSRKALDAFRSMPERHRFLRGMISWIGFERDFVEFEAPSRAAGESKYTWRKMFRLALTAVYSFSAKPLRMAIRVGIFNAFLGMLYLMFVLWSAIFQTENRTPGWASVIAVVLIIGGVQLVFTGLIGEYVARLYEEAKQRPLYFVKKRSTPRNFSND